jgi:hypothetical protein
MTHADLSAEAATAPARPRVVGLVRWVGAGRRLTKTGRLTVADARALVALLDTGDETDHTIDDKAYKLRSSEDLPVLNLTVDWARAVGLLRAVHGRLVPVAKHAQLLDRPLDLWAAMLDGFGKLGDAVCFARYRESLLGDFFPEGTSILFGELAGGGGSGTVDELADRMWDLLIPPHALYAAEPYRVDSWRHQLDADLGRAIDVLVDLGALVEDEPGAVRLTPLADWALRRRFAPRKSGEPVAQLRIELRHIEPPIWRRVLVPAALRLDRLHTVIQEAMGWQDYHLHMFTKDDERYGSPDPDFPLRNERRHTLRDLAAVEGASFDYEYDFGDSWDHHIVLEKLLEADPDGRYPICVAGARACPPEDCGGPWGYARLDRRDFDPERFDLDDVNRRINVGVRR